jgi:hypothetical protein
MLFSQATVKTQNAQHVPSVPPVGACSDPEEDCPQPERPMASLPLTQHETQSILNCCWPDTLVVSSPLGTVLLDSVGPQPQALYFPLR